MMQVTDVTNALMSVSNTCDAGRRVVFERAEGSHNDSNSLQKRGWCLSDEGEAR